MVIVRILQRTEGYKLGEIIEVSTTKAVELFEKRIAERATEKELNKCEQYQLGISMKSKLKQEALSRLRHIKIKIDNYIENSEYFHTTNPFFYDEVGIFWFWDTLNYKYVQQDEINVMNLFDNVLGFEGQTVSRGTKANYLEAFKRVAYFLVAKAGLREIEFVNDNVVKFSPDSILDEETLNFNEISGVLN